MLFRFAPLSFSLAAVLVLSACAPVGGKYSEEVIASGEGAGEFSDDMNRPGFNGDSVYVIPTNSFGRLVPA